MPQTATILPIINPKLARSTNASSSNLRQLTKAGLIFITTTGAFSALKTILSFSLITALFKNTLGSELMEDGVIEAKDNSVVTRGALDVSPHKQVIQHDEGLGTSAENIRESVGLAEFKELPMHDFQERQLLSFPEIIELSSLDGTNGFRLDGEAAYDLSGYSVSAAGDINGDGVGDVIVGAYKADPSGRSYAGRSYVVFGHNGTWPSPIELSSLNGNNGFKLDGEAAGDWSGYSVSAAGDVNGDGIADLIVGARQADPSERDMAGRSYVVFGHNGTWPSPIELSSLNGSNGFKLDGEAEYDGSGISVSVAGDINGDGVGDVIVGAPYANLSGRSDAGRSYVVFGHNGTWPSSIELSSLNGTNGFKLDGEAVGDWSGMSVSAAGDINGDGVADIIVGAYRASPSGRSYAGRRYVVFGRNGTWPSSIELSSLNGTNGFKSDGEAVDDFSGYTVSAAGDINGDGVGDVIVGAYCADPSGRSWAGRSYVVFGHNGTWSSSIELSSLNGNNGFKLDGEAADDESGYSVSAAGDINGDGVADLIVGTRYADRSYVVFGHNGTWPSLIELSSLNGNNGFKLGDWSGRSVSAAGDINGDGVADLIVGAPEAGVPGRLEAGRSYVVFGRSAKSSSEVSSSGYSSAISSLKTISSTTSTSSVETVSSLPEQSSSTTDIVSQLSSSSPDSIKVSSSYSSTASSITTKSSDIISSNSKPAISAGNKLIPSYIFNVASAALTAILGQTALGFFANGSKEDKNSKEAKCETDVTHPRLSDYPGKFFSSCHKESMFSQKQDISVVEKPVMGIN